mmetsp:Transcript_26413/g.47633  ORF Transcript_26413/g.47633 Transcript_26413/m.47633 type:complete len:362 (-) Transcript_26413:12-1097(-)
MSNPCLEKVLARYPGVDPAALDFPSGSEDWDEAGLDLFVGSGGFLKPKKRPTAGGYKVAAVGGFGTRLEALAKSAWWVNNPNPRAKIRLFCAMGIGSVASTYGPWVSKASHEKYPDLEVCVVEFPGHGTNFGEPLASVDALAEALLAELEKSQGSSGGKLQPLALFGFSMGANVMYRLAQKLGKSCRKLYVAGRAPPHFPAPLCEKMAPEVARLNELLEKSDVAAVSRTLLEDVLPIFMAPAQLKTYGRIMESRLLREDGRQEIARFARSLVLDCRVGMDANEVPRDFHGDIHFYYSRCDETWPLSVDGMYEDFPFLWAAYTKGSFQSEETEAVSHDDLGGVNSPIFQAMCKDLTAICQST